MKWVLFACLALTVILSPAPIETNLIKKAQKSVAYVSAGESMCSGIVVTQIQVLTAKHCVKEANMEVDGKPARVLKIQDELALLEVEDLLEKPIANLGPLPEVGETVMAMGYAYDGPLTVLIRHIASHVKEDIAIDGALAPGMSGGPIFNERGEVVGVNQMTTGAIGIACGPTEIKAFLGRK